MPDDASAMSDEKIVCPCCPLHCDDLSGASLSSSPEHCSLAFTRIRAVLDHHSRSTTAEADQAQLERCAEWIRASRRTVITGRVLDLATSRAVVKFSEQVGADIQVAGPNRSSQAVMKRDGSYTCTLGELTRATNSLLIIGDVESAWPRISRHLTTAKEIAQLEDSPALLDQLAALRMAAASESASPLPESLAQAVLRQALEMVRQASYLVVVIAPLQEDAVRSPLVWSSMFGLVQAINRTRRAAILTLDETYTLRSTMASRMEQVPQGVTAFEPTLQIHLSPFGEPCDFKSQSMIYVGQTATRSSVQLCLPAAIPGIDVPGIVYRGDGSVALPLVAWKHSLRLPTPGERLEQLLELVDSSVH